MTTVITGRDLTLSIDAVDHDVQTLGYVLTQEHDRQRYELIDGARYKVIDVTGSLEVRLMADWGDAASLCGALWDASATDPNTALDVVLESNGDSWAGKVYPTYPAGGPGGEGKTAQEVAFTLPVADDVVDGLFVRTAAVV